MTEIDKEWFYERRDKFVLGVSLDGSKETHDYNRCNSFDKIDIPFFVKTWPNQGPKMTISKKSLDCLAHDVIFLHKAGFKFINGVNLAEGDFDWSNEDLLWKLSSQLSLLVKFYVENPLLELDQLMGRHIEYCDSQKKYRKKICGIGENTIFYDVDGSKYPCSYMTPMTFSKESLANALSEDFSDISSFIDEDCFQNCYLYPVCSSCAGANYLAHGNFSQRNKSKCKLIKIIALYVAELHMQRILQNKHEYGESELYFLIDAIKEIKNRYYYEFEKYMVKNRFVLYKFVFIKID